MTFTSFAAAALLDKAKHVIRHVPATHIHAIIDDPFNYPMAACWSKPFAARVRSAANSEMRWKEAQLATLEAVVRRLVRRGWKRYHTSNGSLNSRASSRYLSLRKHKYAIRISDHRMHRNQYKTATWQKEYLISKKVIKGYNILGLIGWIERDATEFKLEPQRKQP